MVLRLRGADRNWPAAITIGGVHQKSEVATGDLNVTQWQRSYTASNQALCGCGTCNHFLDTGGSEFSARPVDSSAAFQQFLTFHLSKPKWWEHRVSRALEKNLGGPEACFLSRFFPRRPSALVSESM